MTERRAAEEAVGHRATPTSANSLPKPERDSGNMPMTPLPTGSPPQWHTLHHGLGSTNLLVDAKLGGTNAPGPGGVEPLDRDALRAQWAKHLEVPVEPR